MGLFDCVSDKSAKYPVNPPPANQAPLQRGMSKRRSMGLFASTTSLKGHKDVDFWRHRLLGFLYKSEGREDVGNLRMPLKQMGYVTIGDFIRDIPSDIYAPYKNQLNPDTGLRKDYKVIWERDGIAEPGILKWEGMIEGLRCMGLQLDRKKAVPFGINDGKGLFFCKPGHRALVPVDEVHAYKSFLRQFVGTPRKDSMPLNLLPGRSSVRVAVAKQYQPGDHVHLPTENKWATILWTGRIEGEWVVDLVYDPEKPAKGRMASPDEPCMSRSLSMAEFIDQLGPEDSNENVHSPSPPKHVPPPPPMTPPPKSPEELEDEVFITRQQIDAETESESSEVEEEDSVSEEESHSDEIHSAIEPPLASSSPSESEDERQLSRTASEPGPDLSKSLSKKKQPNKKLEMFEQPPLESKQTHKPMFNLASLGRKKSQEKKSKKPEPPTGQSPNQSPKKGFSLFKSKSSPAKEKKVAEPELVIKRVEDEPTSFTRKDRSRSPVYKKQPDISRIGSEEHNELPVDVPVNLRSPKSFQQETPKPLVRLSSNETDSIPSPKPRTPEKVSIIPIIEPIIQVTTKESSLDESSSEEEEQEEASKTGEKAHVEVDVELTNPLEREPSECSSDTTPPYSPIIKDVGFGIKRREPKPNNKNNTFRFGGIFSSKKKALPPKDYKELEPQPPTRPIRKESLEHKFEADRASHSSEEFSPEQKHSRQNSYKRKHLDGLFRRLSKTRDDLTFEPVEPHRSPQKHAHLIDTMGDQDGLVLDSLEVKDEIPQLSNPPVQSPEIVSTKRKGSKGKTFSFGFSKKQKPTEEKEQVSVEDTEMIQIVEDTPQHQPEAKPKKSSFKDSFTRTFSFSNKGKTRHESLGEEKAPRPGSLYIDNNEAIGVSNISRPKSKSASVLVDIQPWNERKGYSKYDIYEDSPEEAPRSTPSSPTTKSVPALLPKQPDPNVPKHRIFTTPIGLFGLGHKTSSETPKSKTASLKASKLPKVTSPKLPPLSPKIVAPSEPPPPIPVSQLEDEVFPSPSIRRLKSAMKQRKEIEAIPKGVKVGDRVIWYNGRIPVPGTVLKLYKDGTDKYTAIVNFDRVNQEPLSLAREGDDYVVTVEELLTSEIFSTPTSPVTTPVVEDPSFPIYQNQQEILEEENEKVILEDDCKSPTVRFSSPEPPPLINVDLTSPVLGLPPIDEDDDRIPPPFQEEEIELACGTRRGIPSRDKTSCLETILFAMFYTTNTFDTSLLYGSHFEQESITKDIRILLRDGIVNPLRQSGFCEWAAVSEMKELMQKTATEFNSISTDAEIMTFLLFDRALKLGKFISYSTGMVDYLHQLVLDPKDLGKSNTLQQLFEVSLEQMEHSKLKTCPSPALIIEIPRSNNKLIHYEAVIPNLTISVSHLLENGPRLCICGVVAKYECLNCTETSGDKALVFCDNCTSMADQIHFQLSHPPALIQVAQLQFSMDLVAVICVKEGHYTSFVKCGSQRASPWLFYDAAEVDNPKVSLEQNLGMWIDRLERYPGKYHEAFVHPLLTHFLSNSHICIYQPREKSSLV